MKKYIKIALSLYLLVFSFSCSENQEIKTDILTKKEAYRNQFHFSPKANWMNDPNGMVYYEGEYHLFYQYYPDSTVWGPMHWGHAVSRDMIIWEHLPIALYPDENGYIFSGSAVIDWDNTSGLGSEENPAMVAIFTYHDPNGEKAGNIDYQTQGVAYSTDKGRTWTVYEENPVLANPGIKDFRDPKVSWHEETGKWIMTLAVLDHISFYSSSNLLDWKLESDFGKDIGAHGGVWECPDLFKLPVEGSQEEKWVLLVSINPGAPNGGSGTQYFVGDFDGNSFTLDESYKPDLDGSIWIDYGTDNYAGVTWSDRRGEDGRRIFLGWMSNWQYANLVPTKTWRSAMTVPRTLNLLKENDRYILMSNPVEEIDRIKASSTPIDPQVIEGSSIIQTGHFTYELLLELNTSQASGFDLVFSNSSNQKVVFGINKDEGQAYFNRSKSGAIDFEAGFANLHSGPYDLGDSVSITILVDVASMEVFIDKGRFVMTEIFFPDDGYDAIEIISKDGILEVESGSVSELKSIW